MVKYWLDTGKMKGVQLPSGRWRIRKIEIQRILGTLEVGGE